MKTTTKILLAVGSFVGAFIVSMIVIFCIKGETPDTLITYTLGAGGVEAILCAIIKSAKIVSGRNEREDETV